MIPNVLFNKGSRTKDLRVDILEGTINDHTVIQIDGSQYQKHNAKRVQFISVTSAVSVVILLMNLVAHLVSIVLLLTIAGRVLILRPLRKMPM